MTVQHVPSQVAPLSQAWLVVLLPSETLALKAPQRTAGVPNLASTFCFVSFLQVQADPINHVSPKQPCFAFAGLDRGTNCDNKRSL